MACVDTLHVEVVAVAVVHLAASCGGLVHPLGVVGVECGGELGRMILISELYRTHFLIDSVGVGGV